MPGGWVRIGKKVGGWAITNADTWVPTMKKATFGAGQRLTSREKAISQATHIGGQFAQVWLKDHRYWVVRKDGEIVNVFPRYDDDEGLKRAAAHVREEFWKTPESLLRRRAKTQVAKVRRRRGDQGRGSGE